MTVTTTGMEAGEEQPNAVALTEKLPPVVTLNVLVTAPVLQTLPDVALEVKVTELPEQNVVGPLAVTVGVAGIGLTTTLTGTEAVEEHPNALAMTENVPVVFTFMLWIVSPLLQTFPVVALEVSVTLSPLQKVVLPLAAIVGIAGIGFTVTKNGAEGSDVQPNWLVVVTVIVAVFLTLMLWVVSPVLHKLFDEALDVRVTLSPLQKVVEPLAEMVGVAGFGLTTTLIVLDLPDLQPNAVVVTVKLPEKVTLIDWVTCSVLHSFPVVALDIRITLSPRQKVVLPTTVISGVVGIGFAVTTVGAEVAEQPLALVLVTVKLPLVFTLMLFVVSPLLQRFPLLALEVSITLSPLQKVIGLLAEITGTRGTGFTVTWTKKNPGFLQPRLSTTTEKLPLVFTVILFVVCPLLHRLSDAALEVSMTLSPWQKVVLPLAEMVGFGGTGLIVIVNGREEAELHPSCVVNTVKVPVDFTFILFVVSPLLHKLPEAALEVSVTLSPSQKVVAPLAVIVGFTGTGFTVTITEADDADEHPNRFTDTLKVPDALTLMLWDVSPLVHTFPDVALEVKVTLSPWQNVVLPVIEIPGVGGIGFATIVVGNELALHPFASVVVTEKFPLPFTVILCVVSLLFHLFPESALEVNITLSPAQNVVGLFVAIVGVGGNALTVTKTGSEVDLQPLAFERITVKLPADFTTMLLVLSSVLHTLLVAELDVSVTLSP